MQFAIDNARLPRLGPEFDERSPVHVYHDQGRVTIVAPPDHPGLSAILELAGDALNAMECAQSSDRMRRAARELPADKNLDHQQHIGDPTEAEQAQA